jgi:hypothetical protein
MKKRDILAFEDILLRPIGENDYYSLIDTGENSLYFPGKTGQIALIINVMEKP